MSADEHLGIQFLPIEQVGRMESGDFPGFTMNQFYHAPNKLRSFHDITDSYNRQDYRDLTDSVREQGMHTPLHVGDGEHGPAVWDGHHRYIAARRAGLTHLPVAYGPAAIDNAVAAYHENRGA